MRKIVVIGGGENGRVKEDGSGRYPYDTEAIDRRILELTGVSSPRVAFVPTGTKDARSHYECERDKFLKIGAEEVAPIYLLDRDVDIETIRSKVMQSDVVYVGGGNTLYMMNVWRKTGFDKILREAYEKGIVLSGLSAGSICWFDYGVSDSRIYKHDKEALTRVRGLGLIPYTHCPHYSDRPGRKTELKKAMRRTPGVAIALDDGAALEVVDGRARVLTSMAGAKGCVCYWRGGEYFEELIEPGVDFEIGALSS